MDQVGSRGLLIVEVAFSYLKKKLWGGGGEGKEGNIQNKRMNESLSHANRSFSLCFSLPWSTSIITGVQANIKHRGAPSSL